MNRLNLNEVAAMERLLSISGDIISGVCFLEYLLMYVFDVCKQSCSMLGVIDEPLNLRPDKLDLLFRISARFSLQS